MGDPRPAQHECDLLDPQEKRGDRVLGGSIHSDLPLFPAVAREQLGAKRVEKVVEWWVMEAPTGHRFCVGRPARSELPREGNPWE